MKRPVEFFIPISVEELHVDYDLDEAKEWYFRPVLNTAVGTFYPILKELLA